MSKKGKESVPSLVENVHTSSAEGKGTSSS